MYNADGMLLNASAKGEESDFFVRIQTIYFLHVCV